MTVDAVGGVWRYAIDLGRALSQSGVEIAFVGLGPSPTAHQCAEAAAVPGATLAWLDAPLDWTARNETDIARVPHRIAALAHQYAADLLHLNLPSQACGLACDLPVVTVSHSCVVTWWQAVRGTALPKEWEWMKRANQQGLARADIVLAPSRGHADALARAYGPLQRARVCHNASAPGEYVAQKEPWVFAAGRWWDEGKNGAVLDKAAPLACWPVRAAGPLAGPHRQRFAFQHARALGEQSGAEVRALMARAAIFVAPSLYEPFGLAVLEAAHAACALVLADIPVFRELWGDAAIFADPNRPQAFAAAIDGLAQDAERRVQLGARAKARARVYSPERQCSAVLSAYRDAMARRSSLRVA